MKIFESFKEHINESKKNPYYDLGKYLFKYAEDVLGKKDIDYSRTRSYAEYFEEGDEILIQIAAKNLSNYDTAFRDIILGAVWDKLDIKLAKQYYEWGGFDRIKESIDEKESYTEMNRMFANRKAISKEYGIDEKEISLLNSILSTVSWGKKYNGKNTDEKRLEKLIDKGLITKNGGNYEPTELSKYLSKFLLGGEYVYEYITEGVAGTILTQLGGYKFMAMTGANNLIDGGDYLSLKIKRNKTKANYLKITLNKLDLYDMVFSYVRVNSDEKEIERYENVDFEQLQTIFTKVTGLYTKL
jgi:hypothetical protein